MMKFLTPRELVLLCLLVTANLFFFLPLRGQNSQITGKAITVSTSVSPVSGYDIENRSEEKEREDNGILSIISTEDIILLKGTNNYLEPMKETAQKVGMRNPVQVASNPTIEHSALATASFSPLAPDLLVYPNPTVDWLTIDVKNQNEQLRSVTIYQLSGQLVLRQAAVDNQQCRLNVSHLEKGNYFVHTTTSAGTTVRQIAK